MAKPAARIIFLEVLLALGGAGIAVRSFMLQVVQHDVWQTKLKQWREADADIAARRGRIFDRNGNLLASSQEQYRIGVALNEVPDTAALVAEIRRDLGVSPAKVDAEFRRDYAYFYGPFTAERVARLLTQPGVHPEVLYQRVYPMQGLADRILGHLDDNGAAGVEGMERALDTLLQGKPGKQHYMLDAKGMRLPEPGPPLVRPVAGHDVYLTLDRDLQGVVEGALRDAVATSKAHGGDIVILDIHTGELLAIASLRTDTASGKLVSTSSAIVEPNQPGSTSKLFTVAAILRTGTDTTPVDGEGGKWLMPIGRGKPRTIEDVEPRSGLVTLGETVKYSSNIAISKFSVRLRPDQQFEAIRDFGFGAPLGIGFPGEEPGLLRRPALWINRLLTQPSLGQGYEWEATSAQLAVGYAAIANHGTLLTPSLVREVRDERGTTTWRHRPDTVRQAVPDSVARKLMDYLKLVTDSGGTGSRAQLDLYRVAGKTGTAKIRDTHQYRASFAGIFSVDNPQAVIYVMIDRPTVGSKFGGLVAAPVVATMMKQALALQESPFDRSSLTSRVTLASAAPVSRTDPVMMQRVAWPLQTRRADDQPAIVPVIEGHGVRDAIVLLERAGFNVHLVGRSRVRGTAPAAGDSLPRGATVTLYADSLR